MYMQGMCRNFAGALLDKIKGPRENPALGCGSRLSGGKLYFFPSLLQPLVAKMHKSRQKLLAGVSKAAFCWIWCMRHKRKGESHRKGSAQMSHSEHLPVLEQDPLAKCLSANVFLKSLLGALLESFLPLSHCCDFAGVAALLAREDPNNNMKKNKISRWENNILYTVSHYCISI